MEYEVRISEGIKPLAEWSVDMAEDYISLVAELVWVEFPDCTLRHDADRDTTAPRRIDSRQRRTDQGKGAEP